MGHTWDVPDGRSGCRVAMLAVGLALAIPAVAAAEPVAQLGQGRNPSAVTDATGTLHVVWNVPAPLATPSTTMYCRLAVGATACQPVALPQPAGSNAQTPHILLRPADGALFVVAVIRGGPSATYAYASGDGGTTWSGPTAIGTGVDDVVQARLTADGAAVETVGSFSAGLPWQRDPLAGPAETRAFSLVAGTRFGFGTPLGLATLPDGRTAVVSSETVSGPARFRTAMRVLSGPDPYQEPSWSAWTQLPSVPGSVADLDAGPSGTWLLSTFSSRLRVRQFNGTTFRVPKTMGTLAGVGGGEVGDNPLPPRDLNVDLAGRVHVAWVPPANQCGPAVCIAYRRSEPYGFGPTFTYPLAHRSEGMPSSLVVAPNAGGSGWVVWGHEAGSNLRAAPLVTPPRYSRTGSLVLGKRRRITLPARRGCIPSGSRFVHHADLSGLHGDVRIVSVRFFFDNGQLARVDHRAPYRVTYKLTFAPLSRHVAAARVTYRSRGKLRHATIGRMIVMCPA